MAVVAQRWNINALATELGLNYRTIARRLARVAPAGKNEHGAPVYLLADAAPAILGAGDRRETVTDLNRERARLARAQSEKTELDLAERRGELVEVVEVRAKVYELAKMARDALVLLPARLSPQLVGLDQHSIERKMVIEIADVCEHLRRPVLETSANSEEPR